MLAIAGRHDEGIATSLAAIERDPESYIAHFALQYSYEVAGRHGWAAAMLATSGRHGWAAAMLATSGRHGWAAAMLATSGRHGWAAAMLATTYGAWGKPSDARAVYDQLVTRAADAYVQPTVIAWSAAAAGFPDDAVRFVAQVLRERDPFLMIVLKHIPHLEPVRRALREAGTYDATLRQLGIA